MIEFAQPWAVLLLPLPVLVRFIWHRAEAQHPALYFPQAVKAAGQSARPASGRMHPLRLALLAIAWLALVGAAAAPRYIGDAVTVPDTGRDLMLAIDISQSMLSEDLELDGRTVDRLTVLRAVSHDFLSRRRGDRIGLILFGTRAYLHVPLTFDHVTLERLLDEAQIGFAGPQTAIGDAIGLAVKHLRDRPQNARVLILITDGANTAGELGPQQAAQLAARAGLRIHVIGVGAESMTLPGLLGGLLGSQRLNPSADLDEETLSEIARRTGGRYFRARDQHELEQIYAELDRLEPVEQDPRFYRPQVSLAHWPLAAALLLTFMLAGTMLMHPRQRRGSARER